MWGARADPETEQMATMVGMFAAGSLSSMDRYNSRIQVTGEQIQVGVRLVVTWGYGSYPPTSREAAFFFSDSPFR